MKTAAILFVLAASLLAAPQIASADPVAFYLEVPGITGASSTPGHPNVIQLLSYSINGQDLTVTKLINTDSTDILLASINGTQFPTVSLLLYDNVVPGPQPDATITFNNGMISSYQTIVNPTFLTEQVTFSFAVPEPASLSVLGAGAVLLLRRRR